MKRNPHFQQREVFTEWENVDGKTIKGISMFPKFKNNPSRFWRACPKQGPDTEDVMSDLGYSAEQISEMEKVIRKAKK